jgi:leucyl aminopeptidase
MARQIMRISVEVKTSDPIHTPTDLLAVGLFSDGTDTGLIRALDQRFGGAITRVRKLGDCTGKPGSMVLLYNPTDSGPRRVLLVGLGARKKASLEILRNAVLSAASKAVDVKAKTAAIAIHHDFPLPRDIHSEQLAQALTESAYFGAYRWDEYLPKDDNGRPEKLVVVLLTQGSSAHSFERGVDAGSILGEAQNYARTIMNRPANQVTPEVLAAEARQLARHYSNLTCSVLNDKQLTAKGFGGILAVGQGSAHPPRLIVVKYRPRKALRVPTIALVGKAITFDSGGISIKPSEGMQDMKFDKSGGVSVLASMRAIAELKPQVNVVGLIPSAENMPGGGSYRPGDIVTTHSGKTVEIQNTDAEGRMLLCDAIHYATQLRCNAIVDVATLTGACVVALGEWTSGVMGSSDPLVAQLKSAATATGEKIWELPCGEEYLDLMKSKIADLKNTGGRWGGACSAAAFLREFADKTPWAHLDIAGVGCVDGGKKFGSPGSIGFGVRLLSRFVCDFKSIKPEQS